MQYANTAEGPAGTAEAGRGVRSEPVVPPADGLAPLCDALLDSRRRWRDLALLGADMAFETDANGCFTFLAPERPLGWPGDRLIGQPGSTLLAESAALFGFNPFRQQAAQRNRYTWLQRPDGSLACLRFSVSPLPSPGGATGGMRGVGQDITEQDNVEHAVAIALRRCQVLDHILWSIRQEVLAPRMMQLLLDSLAAACGADGIAIIDTLSSATSPTVLHQSGAEPSHVLGAALTALDTENPDGAASVAPNGTGLLTCLCHTRAGDQAGLVVWRAPGARPWDDDDRAVTTSAAVLVRMILEHESIQREMTLQARTDPLTGLLNRRAFMEEAGRRTERLDREGVPSTLMFVDLDGFKQLNDGSGHDVGDEALRRVADLLRDAVRPTDLVARLGGDEFAIWMDGADELAASERAERLCIEGPELLSPMGAPLGLTLSLSIGITTRWPGRGEDVDALLHRADQVMYEVKRAGRGHWRVSRSDSW